MTLAGSDLFVTNNYGNVVEYTTSGVEVNPALISGLGYGTWGIAVTGGHIFVSNVLTNSIGEYNMDGTVVNASLINGFGGLGGGPYAITALGSDLFVTDGDGIGEYTTSGATVDRTLVTSFGYSFGILAVPDVTFTFALLGFSLIVLALIGGQFPRATRTWTLRQPR
jgi:hypothetical protein